MQILDVINIQETLNSKEINLCKEDWIDKKSDNMQTTSSEVLQP